MKFEAVFSLNERALTATETVSVFQWAPYAPTPSLRCE